MSGDEEELEVEEFEVEAIIDKRFVKGKTQYHVKWVGFSMGELDEMATS